MEIKQVIVYRRDLKMRKGKIAAQVAHASMKVFFDRGQVALEVLGRPYPHPFLIVPLTEEMAEWVEHLFGKIVLSVEGEVELLEVYRLAQEAGIPCALITDAGRTEFKKPCATCVGHGFFTNDTTGHTVACEVCEGSGRVPNPTHTTVALGPARAEDIDKITGPNGAVATKLA